MAHAVPPVPVFLREDSDVYLLHQGPIEIFDSQVEDGGTQATAPSLSAAPDCTGRDASAVADVCMSVETSQELLACSASQAALYASTLVETQVPGMPSGDTYDWLRSEDGQSFDLLQ